MSVVEPIFIAAASDAGIRAAQALAVAAGGGVVIIPAVKITLTSPLPLSSGVKYRGTGWRACLYGDFPGSDGGMAGTILEGDGTFPAFAYNNTDLSVAPTVFATFVAGLVQGTGVSDVSLYNFSHGTKCGARYAPGCQWSKFERINARYCGWGMYFENYLECTFSDINVIGPTVGLYYFGASGAAACNAGPSRMDHLYGEIYTNLGRGFVFQARFASYLNQTVAHGCHIDRNVTSTTQAATMANASPNIGVTDSTQFPVDMPVTVSASVNGFAANQIYFVTSSSANVVQIAKTQGGTAVAATGNTAVNLLQKGYPDLELVGLDTSQIQPGTWTGLDLEGSGTTMVLMQNTNGVTLNANLITPGQNYRTITMRNAVESTITLSQDYTIDADNVSGTRSIISGFPLEYNSLNSGDAPGVGLGVRVNRQSQSGASPSQNSGLLYLTGSYDGPTLYINGNSQALTFNRHVALAQAQIASGGTIGSGAYASSYVYSGAGGGNLTLPSATINNYGLEYEISNPSSGTLTITTSGGQLINNAAATTSFVMAANSVAKFRACYAPGPTLYWSAK